MKEIILNGEKIGNVWERQEGEYICTIRLKLSEASVTVHGMGWSEQEAVSDAQRATWEVATEIQKQADALENVTFREVGK